MSRKTSGAVNVPSCITPSTTRLHFRDDDVVRIVGTDVVVRIGDKAFEVTRDLLEVTSNYRADTAWLYTDKNGHVHRWHVDGKPAVNYDPAAIYHVPTLHFVQTGTWTSDDGETYPTGYNACHKCGDAVEPGFTADTVRQFIPGIARFHINGRSVSKDAFFAELEAARGGS